MLQEYCTENKITLLKDYSKEKIKSRMKIEGRCIEIGCENTFEKSFTSLLQYEIFFTVNLVHTNMYVIKSKKHVWNDMVLKMYFHPILIKKK